MICDEVATGTGIPLRYWPRIYFLNLSWLRDWRLKLKLGTKRIIFRVFKTINMLVKRTIFASWVKKVRPRTVVLRSSESFCGVSIRKWAFALFHSSFEKYPIRFASIFQARYKISSESGARASKLGLVNFFFWILIYRVVYKVALSRLDQFHFGLEKDWWTIHHLHSV